MEKTKTITLGRLRRELDVWRDAPDDTPVYFGSGDLSLLRLKDRGGAKSLIQFEFAELYEVTLDPSKDG